MRHTQACFIGRYAQWPYQDIFSSESPIAQTTYGIGADMPSGSRILHTLGAELKGFRVAAGIDVALINYPFNNVGTNYTFQVGYIAPYGKAAHKRTVVCDRF